MADDAFQIRNTTSDDAPAIVDLINAYSEVVVGDTTTTPELLDSLWSSTHFNLNEDAWVVHTPDGELVGYAHLFALANFTRLMQAGYVHPLYWGQGIGSLLLKLIDERAEYFAQKALHDERVALYVRVDMRDALGNDLLTRNGYKHDRNWWSMEIDLANPLSEVELPENIVMTPYNEERDALRLYEADEEAFQDHYGNFTVPFEEWLQHFKNDPGYDPHVWYLAMDGDEIAGFIICQTERSGKKDLGWIRVVGVRKPWRRQGLGLAMLYYAFEQLKQRGKARVGLSVDSENTTGATGLYERAGMKVTEQFALYVKVLRAGD